MLQGYGMSQDPTDPTKYVQGSTLGAINIPIGQKIPAKETELVGFRCNLNSSVPTYLASGFTPVGTQQKVTLNGTQYTVTLSRAPEVHRPRRRIFSASPLMVLAVL
jgi:flagellar hook protein FlgE